jgi:predicted nucleotidyltransferase
VTASALSDAERRVASAVTEIAGERPILLCGSRATGTADGESDYDVVVVVPAAGIPRQLRRLPAIARRLEAEIGAPVTVNPLPFSRLRKGRSLYVWKLRREARVLAAPTGFGLGDAGPAPLTRGNEFSYLASAAFYLLGAIRGPDGSATTWAATSERGMRKCLLHLVQLRLMRQGRYASSLPDALDALGDPHLAALERLPGEARLLAIRDELLPELRAVAADIETSGVRIANARYALLAALRGRSRLRTLLAGRRIDVLLVRAAGALLEAALPGGALDEARARSAAAELPFPVEPASRSWEGARGTLLLEWPDAHPLGAQ